MTEEGKSNEMNSEVIADLSELQDEGGKVGYKGRDGFKIMINQEKPNGCNNGMPPEK